MSETREDVPGHSWTLVNFHTGASWASTAASLWRQIHSPSWPSDRELDTASGGCRHPSHIQARRRDTRLWQCVENRRSPPSDQSDAGCSLLLQLDWGWWCIPNLDKRWLLLVCNQSCSVPAEETAANRKPRRLNSSCCAGISEQLPCAVWQKSFWRFETSVSLPCRGGGVALHEWSVYKQRADSEPMVRPHINKMLNTKWEPNWSQNSSWIPGNSSCVGRHLVVIVCFCVTRGWLHKGWHNKPDGWEVFQHKTIRSWLVVFFQNNSPALCPRWLKPLCPQVVFDLRVP